MLEVAEDLLGKTVVCKKGRTIVEGMMTEVEAYDGPQDKACHAAKGCTARTQVLFGPAGNWYVYLVYGMHWMLNIVTGNEGYPAAVLIRGAGEWNGPGKITKAFGIDKQFNGKTATEETGLWIEDRGVIVPKNSIERTSRIGVDYAGEWAKKPYRFCLQKRTIASVFGAALLLFSCTTSSSLNPKLVLQRSTEANQRLQTVEVRANFFIDDIVMGKRERISVHGQLQNSGTEFFAQIGIDRQGEISSTFSIMHLQDGSIFITNPSEKKTTNAYSPENINTYEWFLLESPQEQMARNIMNTVLFDVQENGIHITKDGGLSLLRGRKHFYYQTAMDPPDNDITLRGELWIDAKTFLTNRIIWTIEEEQKQRVSLTIDLFEHNAVAPFSLPKNVQIMQRKDRLELLEQLSAISSPLLQTLLKSQSL
ncbi:hypothetical protein A3D11_01325 [Candidatus Peribacteria bacterium RIFCSPHIGHO2_02_FULL_49_16]|nr:MAG: hypothetical protein A2880_02450 [Candidatus Peribacteria bacterium RIFCSPHIGHO2_01_FULL_49_38]OGJ59588.1 MAG: hypothetical protein A3D11_01325 [Candidatus Peribacteria bacterium RIFCSPHIGHO2_02_FULL_49_16]